MKNFKKLVTVAALLGMGAFAEESTGKASFQVGPGVLYGWPAFGQMGASTGLFFDGSVPTKYNGVNYQMGTFVGGSYLFKYLNVRDDIYTEDINRSFYWGGFSFGPSFNWGSGPVYFSG